ncbi:hypothetical protein [Actinomadura verrucosospora]|nr:hypothetical protein [Actinomadura verrucosospora]
MPIPSRLATTATALTVALATAAAAPAAGAAERVAPPEGKIIVFVTEGTQVSWAGTRLKEYSPSSNCQSLPLGAHVVVNDGTARLRFYSDPFCAIPVPPPFSSIPPGYGAHVSPTGSFRTG